MSTLRLLVVEDELHEVKSCKDSAKTYAKQKGQDIDLVVCETIDKAIKKLDNYYDGAIIDLKLTGQGYEGNQVIDKIVESLFRIPVVILTGTPGKQNEDSTYFEVFKKGEITYHELFDRFTDIRNTGITNIMGGKGLIEARLSEVFRKNLLPQIRTWESYGKQDSKRTEKALVRYTLNHLLQLLEEDEEHCFPEEVYLFPPFSEDPTTGSIVKEKLKDKWFVVMNPACDLVVRKNVGRNTERILVVEVDPGTELFSWFECQELSNQRQGDLKNAFRNKKSTNYHWLPPMDFFPGGFLNFRKLSTLENKEFFKRFETPPQIQIAPFFIKDVISRFSSYYARQGQPEIDYSKFLPAQPGNAD